MTLMTDDMTPAQAREIFRVEAEAFSLVMSCEKSCPVKWGRAVRAALEGASALMREAAGDALHGAVAIRHEIAGRLAAERAAEQREAASRRLPGPPADTRPRFGEPCKGNELLTVTGVTVRI